MRPPRTLPLAFALAVLAVAVACLADPDPRGGDLTPTDPAAGRDMAPDPDSAGIVAAQVAECQEGDPDEPNGGNCVLDPLTVVGEDPCPGFGNIWDPISRGCRCIAGMEPDDNGQCQFQGVTPVGGPGISIGGNISNPGETDPDNKKLVITLRCRPGAPFPGEMIECEAKPRNAKGSVVYKWRLSPDPERVPIRDGMVGPVLPRVEVAATSDSVWGGVVAASGKVSVQAMDSVRFAHAHVSFAVDDSHTTPVSFEEGAKLTAYLWGDSVVEGKRLGRNTNGYAEGSSYSVFDVMGGDGAMVSAVGSGPNRSYATVDYTAYRVQRYRQVNKRLFLNGPKEIPDGDSLVRHWDWLKSRGYDPSRLLDGMLGHEGYGRSFGPKPPKGHQEQIEKALEEGKCGDAGAIASRIVATTKSEARELRDSTEAIADRAFVMSTLHNHVHGNLGASGAAAVLWAPGRSPKPVILRDRYNPEAEYDFTKPGCDWTSF